MERVRCLELDSLLALCCVLNAIRFDYLVVVNSICCDYFVVFNEIRSDYLVVLNAISCC